MKQRFSQLPANQQRNAEDLYDLFSLGVGVGYDMANSSRARHKQIERYLAFFFAVAFLVALLALSVFIPDPTPSQAGVFRTVLALAAAGFAMFIPGFLEVEVKPYIRAGGALAVFVVVYFWNPAQYVTETRQPSDAAAEQGLGRQ